MKNVLLVSTTLMLICALPGRVTAGEKLPSVATLSDMGYSGGQLMSDQDGSLVRGKGFYSESMRYHHHHHRQNHQQMQSICHTKHCFTPPTCHVHAR